MKIKWRVSKRNTTAQLKEKYLKNKRKKIVDFWFEQQSPKRFPKLVAAEHIDYFLPYSKRTPFK